MNGGFEMESSETERPRYWQFNLLSDNPSEAHLPNWELDRGIKSSGSQSLRIETQHPDGFVIGQILDAPTHDLANKSVYFGLNIRHQGVSEPPTVMVLAINETLSPDPLLGVGLAGKVILKATGGSGYFRRYWGSFKATHNASSLMVFLTGSAGKVWFDNITVRMQVESKGPDPDPVVSPIATRSFKLGFAQESPRNFSEYAKEELIQQAASHAEVFNVFFHVRWCNLTGEEVSLGHAEELRQANLARDAGLKLALTLDFTHDGPNSIGTIDPMPNGQPIESLATPSVMSAYMLELFELCRLVHPEYVIVGVEMDFFHDKYPDQWPYFVYMFKEITHYLKEHIPGIHVTTYFRLPWMVDVNGHLNLTHAQSWSQLMPELDSIAFSAYPNAFEDLTIQSAPAALLALSQFAPDLPLLIPEFGIPDSSDSQQSELLRRFFTGLSTFSVELACYFSMYDQSYIGSPDWFVQAFGKLGLIDQKGTHKAAWSQWLAIFSTL